MEITKKLMKDIENAGWTMKEDKTDYNFQIYSPVGQDFSFYVSKDKVTDLEGNVTKNKNAIADLNTAINNANQSINSGLNLKADSTRVDTLEGTVNTNSTAIANLKTEINNNNSSISSQLDMYAQDIDGLKKTSASMSSTIDNHTAKIATSVQKDENGVVSELKLSGDSIVINTDNFKVNADGKGTVIVKGDIVATSLTLSSEVKADLVSDLQTAGVKHVDSTYIEYAVSDSNTQAPDQTSTLWNTTLTGYVEGKHIWQRTKTTYSTGESTYSSPVYVLKLASTI